MDTEPHRRTDPRRSLGATGEQLAAEHLIRRGYAILDRNFRTRAGELDIVAANRYTLVFVEVKTLRAGGERRPFDAINLRKRAKVRRMASAWLAARGANRPRLRELRFDAIGIVLERDGSLISLEHLEGAF
jgi:putative endonuclease